MLWWPKIDQNAVNDQLMAAVVQKLMISTGEAQESTAPFLKNVAHFGRLVPKVNSGNFLTVAKSQWTTPKTPCRLSFNDI